MKFYKTFVNFLLRKNTIEISSIYWNVFYGYFLIKFFVALSRTETITWENFIPAKRDPSSTKARSRLAGMKLFPCSHRIKFMKSLLYCRDPGKEGQNFIQAKRDHVITPSEVFLGKIVLKICSKFKGEHPCRSAILIKLLCNFIEIALQHGFSPVNLLHIFKTPFPRNICGWLLLYWQKFFHQILQYYQYQTFMC